jgi:chitinase
MTLRFATAGAWLILLLAACTANATPTAAPIMERASIPANTVMPAVQPTSIPTSTSMPDQSFRIIGYTADWERPVNPAQLSYVTHINYAFLLPAADGSVDAIAHPQILENLVEEAHAAKVKVLISVGGWGLDQEFKQLAASSETRRRFVTAVVDVVQQYHLDGADIDWEYPEAGSPSAGHFTALLQELRAQLAPGKLLTAAVALGKNADGVEAAVFDQVDFLNIMAYDGPGQNHSSYEFAEESLNYWRQRGLPQAKAVLGVPFYSRPGEAPYRELIEADPAAAQVDEIKYYGAVTYYNGIPTMQRKTELARQLGSGIMIWTIASDTLDETSLLKAIDQAAR